MPLTPSYLLRSSEHALSFVRRNGEGSVVAYEEYAVQHGISLSANLRSAFNDSMLLRGAQGSVQLLTDSPVLLIPEDEYSADGVREQYQYVFPSREESVTISNTLSALRVVAVCSVDKDVVTVLGDHFAQVQILPLMVPLWGVFLRRHDSSPSERLYVYCHENRVELAAFVRRRFVFANVFPAATASDAAYYVCAAGQYVPAHAPHDSIILTGEKEACAALQRELQDLIPRVCTVDSPTLLGVETLPLPASTPLDLLAAVL